MNGYVYLATDGRRHKIGRSIKPQERMGYFGKGVKPKLVHCFPCWDPGYVERFLLDKFKQKVAVSEWFWLDEQDVAFIKQFPADKVTRNEDIPNFHHDWLISLKLQSEDRAGLGQILSERNALADSPQDRMTYNDIIVKAIKEYITRRLSEEQNG